MGGWAHAGPKSEIWDPKKYKKEQFSKSKSVLPKMSARSGLAGKRSSRPHLGPSGPIFCVGRKNQKNAKILPIFLGGPMGPIHQALEWTLRMVKESTDALPRIETRG